MVGGTEWANVICDVRYYPPLLGDRKGIEFIKNIMVHQEKKVKNRKKYIKDQLTAHPQCGVCGWWRGLMSWC